MSVEAGQENPGRSSHGSPGDAGTPEAGSWALEAQEKWPLSLQDIKSRDLTPALPRIPGLLTRYQTRPASTAATPNPPRSPG